MARHAAQDDDRIDVPPDTIADALAKAVHDGDIVNLRLVFAPFSPARGIETERFGTPKYAYLLPDDDQRAEPGFTEARTLVKEPAVWEHVLGELDARRPPRLPHELVRAAGDQALRRGKYTYAAQAYEMLRIRQGMQDTCFAQADAALDAGQVNHAARGYLMATGLDYDYAAFPDPLPKVTDFQRRALMLHGVYPERPEDSLPLQPPEVLIRTALGYLLLSAEAATRLEERPLDQRVKLVRALVDLRDPTWNEFVTRYQETCAVMETFQKRLEDAAEKRRDAGDFAQSIEEQLGDDPRNVPARLLGRRLRGGEWWRYMKELAYEHPASVLFISRQLIGDTEILVPRYRSDAPLAAALGIAPG
jgi:hypothetical protein